MNDFIQYITTLGNLHDSKLTKILWTAKESVLEIILNDIYANFDGHPDYEDHLSSRFILQEVSDLLIEVNLTEPYLTIYDWSVETTNSRRFKSVIKFSPGGKISFEFLEANWEEFDSGN